MKVSLAPRASAISKNARASTTKASRGVPRSGALDGGSLTSRGYRILARFAMHRADFGHPLDAEQLLLASDALLDLEPDAGGGAHNKTGIRRGSNTMKLRIGIALLFGAASVAPSWADENPTGW